MENKGCKRCGLFEWLPGTGLVPNPEAKWWQFWSTIDCPECKGTGYQKPIEFEYKQVKTVEEIKEFLKDITPVQCDINWWGNSVVDIEGEEQKQKEINDANARKQPTDWNHASWIKGEPISSMMKDGVADCKMWLPGKEEPITGEWLEAIGFTTKPGKGWSAVSKSVPSLKVEILLGDKAEIYLWQFGDVVKLPSAEHRQEIERLCKVVGFEIRAG